jgi:type IV pilus assembly protein PilP
MLVLTGCASQDMQDLESYVGEVKARKGGRIEPLPEVKVPEIFTYQAQTRPDPFRPFVEDVAEELAAASGAGVRPPENHVKEELEQFPLDTLRMVGTLEREAQRWALVTAPDGAVHRVQPGNYLGKNYGKITQVEDAKVALVEIVPDGIGGWQERQAQLELTD